MLPEKQNKKNPCETKQSRYSQVLAVTLTNADFLLFVATNMDVLINLDMSYKC
jgi:hypothetical protein